MKKLTVTKDMLPEIRRHAIDELQAGKRLASVYSSAITYHWAHGYMDAANGSPERDYSYYPVAPDDGIGIPGAYADGYNIGRIDNTIADIAVSNL